MRRLVPLLFFLAPLSVSAQEERDTTLTRCPVYITDTVTSNNFFIEARPCTIKVYRVSGDLKVVVEQRDQFLTLLFLDRKLRSTRYKISTRPKGKSQLAVKYSFRSGDQVSYVDVANGTVDVAYDSEKKIWLLQVNGTIANLVGTTVTYYRVRANLHVL